jgi:hypothetical protein
MGTDGRETASDHADFVEFSVTGWLKEALLFLLRGASWGLSTFRT